MRHLSKYFKKHPIIPSVRDMKYLEQAMKTEKSVVVFLLAGSIFDLEEAMSKAEKYDKLLIINVDLVQGISQDAKGMEYLAEKNLCDGIISTRNHLIKAAIKCGLMTIQRIFLLDSGSFKTGKHMLGDENIDSVEILPGIAAPYYISHQEKYQIKYPVIAGGLIETKKEVDKLVEAGVLAISTSQRSLWTTDFN
ncbi:MULTISPECIES: glycerol-3-phosphate responsive antiterminator [unclassified Halanaerobium]|uniref:glycerol-3-phosphate responsive antiterminator n=1 Tax=unclassified Halanaerobium TaxID=2641197 RepID=UPI000DF3154B|nr:MULTISPECIES: glycerol-3-phosphate responsive antiterminator [unclassified Halanaerobium]RCW51361.1 glycerol uptake operon antiterminator [Halanaerobium sp. MA284_MarDTE_T2]RCW81440.1 glycerol uptake operon antiterminator [Halanaerobium sp. DL-01]